MLFAADRLVPSQYGSIEDAIDASVDGDTIIVEVGTYNENLDFRGRSITLTSTDPNDPNVVAGTIVDGNGLIATITFPDSEDANCVLTGFTITGAETSDKGGGVRCSSGNITFSKCVFRNNTAQDGGGIFNDIADLIITKCMFIENTSLHNFGGGIYNYKGQLTVTDCIFIGNSALEEGGGLASDHLKSPIVTNCIFIDNSANLGSGMNISHCGATVTNCIFLNNSAQKGGAICTKALYDRDLRLINCTFLNNSADDYGGAVCHRTVGGLTSDMTMTNCILWGNTAFEGPQVALISTATASISYSCLQGGEVDIYDPSTTLNWLSGNIDSDPCFADQDNEDFHLKSAAGRWDPNINTWVTDDQNSPCTDTGDPCSTWTSELFPHGKRINMGAYGGTTQASMSTSTIGNIADVDLSGSVDGIDLKLLIGKWLYLQFLLPEDLNRDGIVNYKDYAIFANNWP